MRPVRSAYAPCHYTINIYVSQCWNLTPPGNICRRPHISLERHSLTILQKPCNDADKRNSVRNGFWYRAGRALKKWQLAHSSHWIKPPTAQKLNVWNAQARKCPAQSQGWFCHLYCTRTFDNCVVEPTVIFCLHIYEFATSGEYAHTHTYINTNTQVDTQHTSILQVH